MSSFKNRLLARIFTRFPSLVERAAEKAAPLKIEGIPWTPVTKPLKESTVALVTTAGVHLASQKPFDMEDPDGDPTWRELHSDIPREEYTITHDYYDHRDADRDLNIVFPIDRLQELKEEGLIGGVADTHYGFMGHIAGAHVDTLIKETAPEMTRKLVAAGVDVVLLTPG
ncbi:MAG: glycine/sarcosine/betaine reductase selenoprotein B family protein [Thermodesulfobacteriota bacterium]